MKKVLLIISTCILIIFLTACGKTARTLSPDYAGELQATNGERNYTAVLDTDGETLTLTLSSPETVAGMRYEFKGGELHTTLNGLDCITQPQSLSSTALPRVLNEVFTQTDKAEYQSSEDGADTFLLNTATGSATITAKDGTPQAITAGAWEITLPQEK